MGILDKFKLDGKVAVVTGSTRGLGKACAIALAEAGANVVITGTTLEPAEIVAAEIATATGVETLGLACDVRSKKSVDAMIDAIVARFGQLDIAFNNAGIATVGPAEDITEEQFDDLMAVVNNPAAHPPLDWGRIFSTNYWGSPQRETSWVVTCDAE